MNKTIAMIMSVGMMAGYAKADLIAYWNFNGLSIATASAPGVGGVPTDIVADSGNGNISLNDWSGTVDDFAGSTIGALNGDVAGASLSLVNTTGNGSYIEVSFSMTGYQNLTIDFAVRGTGTGYNSGLWSYSTDGVTFTSFGGNTASTSATFTGAPQQTTSGLDDAATAYLRYTVDGATSATGNNRIDNLQLNATIVPEPATMSMVLLGLLGARGMIHRRKRS